MSINVISKSLFMRVPLIAALWCIGISLGVIAVTLATTSYHTYYAVSPVLESYHHGHLGSSLTELRDTVHQAHDVALHLKPEQIMELWNASNALLRRVPWEHLQDMTDRTVQHIEGIAVDPHTKELVQTVDNLVNHINRLPIDHLLTIVETYINR